MLRISFIALAMAIAPLLMAQEGPQIRKATLPGSAELPGHFKAFFAKEGQETFRWLRRGEIELEANEELAFETSFIEGVPTDEQIARLATVPFVSRLHLNASDLRPETLKLIASMSSVTRLSMYGAAITDESAAYFATSTQLTHLSIGSNKLTEKGLKHFAGNSGLRDLGLGVTPLTDDELKLFADCKSLEVLRIDRSKEITGEGFGGWALRELHASLCTMLTDDAVAKICRAGKLVQLDIDFCPSISGSCFDALDGCDSLQVVHASNCGALTDAAVKMLCECQNIWLLDLGQSENLTGECVKYAAGLPKLKRLFVSGLHPGDVQLATLKGHGALEYLDLGGCEITDKSLGALGTIGSLVELYLHHARDLTDEGLAKLSGLKNLSYLSIDDCRNISEAGIAMLKESLPRLRVSHTINNDRAEYPNGK